MATDTPTWRAASARERDPLLRDDPFVLAPPFDCELLEALRERPRVAALRRELAPLPVVREPLALLLVPLAFAPELAALVLPVARDALAFARELPALRVERVLVALRERVLDFGVRELREADDPPFAAFTAETASLASPCVPEDPFPDALRDEAASPLFAVVLARAFPCGVELPR